MKTQVLTFPAEKRVFYVGDIHGCYSLLMDSLREVGFSFDEDVLICTGDLIDRGTQNIKCLELLIKPWFYTVAGNHEVMAYNSVSDPYDRDAFQLWFYNGGHWYMDFYGTDDQRYVDGLIRTTNDLPKIIEVNHGDKKVVVCHADYPALFYPADIKGREHEVLWSRERYLHTEQGTPSRIEGADVFVFGHTPVKEPKYVENILYLDSGAVHSGQLFVTELF